MSEAVKRAKRKTVVKKVADPIQQDSTQTTLKKAAFVKAYEKSFGNISQACKAVLIDRGTYYNWIKDDEAFKTTIDTIEPNEGFLDFAEKALISRITKGDTTAIIFALKTKGKKRGYIERSEIDHSGSVNFDWAQVSQEAKKGENLTDDSAV